MNPKDGIEEFIEQYTKIPRKLLADGRLTEKERILLMVLMSFQYKPGSKIFPSREKLRIILGLKRVENVSQLTKRLQEKGYIHKHTDGRRTYYEVFFDSDIDDSIFTGRKGNDEIFIKPKKGNVFHLIPSQR